jgi:hypothetical protein
MAKLAPAFRSFAIDGQTVSKRIALETKKVEALDRRTAVMERMATERARAREARERAKATPAVTPSSQEPERPAAKHARPSVEFAQRRAEIEAILDTARAEIIEQLLVLCEQWSAGDVTVARCCADVAKLTKSLQ